jgi:YfiH family protein
MIKIKNYYQSSLLSKFDYVEHRFYTKNGGVSMGDFASLNVSFFTIDNKENALANRAIIQKDLNANNHVSTLKQHHSCDVFVLSNVMPVEDMQNILGDGLITNHKDLPIGVFTADCIPILFVEDNCKIVGAIHCGWKGLIGGIIKNTIDKINSLTFHNSNIYAVIGPAIGAKSYEVDGDFYLNHVEQNIEAKNFFSKQLDGKYLYDIKGFAKHLLIDGGVNEDKIEDLGLDTYQLEEDFFSHRRTTKMGKIHRGLQLSCIFLKNT